MGLADARATPPVFSKIGHTADAQPARRLHAAFEQLIRYRLQRVSLYPGIVGTLVPQLSEIAGRSGASLPTFSIRCANRNDKRSKGLAGADRSPRRYGDAAYDVRTGLGEGIPKVPKLRSRALKVFGTVEVAHHQFLPGEIQTLPFKGPVVNLHLSAPHRLVQRQHDLTRKGLVATNDAAITPAGERAWLLA